MSTPKTQSGASILNAWTKDTIPPVTGTVNKGRAARRADRRADSKAFKKSQQQAQALFAHIQPEVDMNRLGNVTRFNRIARRQARKSAAQTEQAMLRQMKKPSLTLRTATGSSIRNVAKAAVAQQAALASVDPPVTTTAMQKIRSVTRNIKGKIGRVGSDFTSSASQQLGRAGNQMYMIGSQTGQVARRTHENRPMTTVGVMVRLMCAVFFCGLTVRFLWVGAPIEMWSLLLVWGVLMLLYFYTKMDLCLKED